MIQESVRETSDLFEMVQWHASPAYNSALQQLWQEAETAKDNAGTRKLTGKVAKSMVLSLRVSYSYD